MMRRFDIEVRSAGAILPGILRTPASASLAVVFAHGSGSSRLSPRNVAVAEVLQAEGYATLLFDLLTDREAADRRNVFDIELLSSRLLDAVETVRSRDDVGALPISLFGASTGAAAAISAAADDGGVAAVVSRGGRPDLAHDALDRVTSPTLLIVGELDRDVLEMNRLAMARMTGSEVRLEIVPGATHLFEEPGALERVAALASSWLRTHADTTR